jgi:uncharacterized membrane protein YeaQ/YmgE (transglycosylase-associated protein family)
MTVFWYLLLGIVIGIIARLVLPGRENMGWFMTVLLGALSAFLAGSIGQWAGWYKFPSWIGFVVAIVIAMVVIFIYTRIKGRAKA